MLSIAFSPDGRVVGALTTTRVYRWERASGKSIDQAELHEDLAPKQVVITRRGRALITGLQYSLADSRYLSTQVVWDMETRKILRTTPSGPPTISSSNCHAG